MLFSDINALCRTCSRKRRNQEICFCFAYVSKNGCSTSMQFSATTLFFTVSILYWVLIFGTDELDLFGSGYWKWKSVLVVGRAWGGFPRVSRAGKFMFMNWEICHKGYEWRGWIWNSVNNFSHETTLAFYECVAISRFGMRYVESPTHDKRHARLSANGTYICKVLC